MSPRKPPIEGGPHRPAKRYLEVMDRAGERVQSDGADLVEWFERYRRQHRARLAVDLMLVERFAEPGARILEIGASPFLLTAALASLDCNLQAVDGAPERFAAAVAELGLAVTRCDVELEPLPFVAASQDLILFNELFEHLHRNPIFTLSEAHRVLKPGGHLLLSTPNLRSFRGLKNLLLHQEAHAGSGGVYDQWRKLELLGHMGHVREYTALEVTEFLRRIGFSIDLWIFRGGNGRGVVGLAERLAPSFRPFFTLVARRPDGNP